MDQSPASIPTWETDLTESPRTFPSAAGPTVVETPVAAASEPAAVVVTRPSFAPTGDPSAFVPPDEFRWMLRALCRGASPSEFFPSDGVGVEMARRVCERCPVREECLEYALEYRIEHGVWGGASERERRRILRQRRLQKAAASR